MQQVALDGLVLPIHNHGLGSRRFRNIQIKDGVVAGIRVQNFEDRLGVKRNGHGLLASAVHYGGDQAGDAHAARCIFVELARTKCSCDCFWSCHVLSFRARSAGNNSLGTGHRVHVADAASAFSLPLRSVIAVKVGPTNSVRLVAWWSRTRFPVPCILFPSFTETVN